MTKTFLQRNVEYKVEEIPYHRVIKYSGRGYYEDGYLMIEPLQDIRITVNSYNQEDLEITVVKYNRNGKQISNTEGSVKRTDLLQILGL